MKFEEKTEKILTAILKGCSTDREIAKETELDIGVIKQIKEGLLKTDAIKERIVIDPYHNKINKGIIIYHLYKCRAGPDQINEASEKLSKLDYVEEIHSIIGQYDLMVKFRVSSLKEYHKVLNEDIWVILEIAGIINSMGIVSLHTYLDRAGYETGKFRKD